MTQSLPADVRTGHKSNTSDCFTAANASHSEIWIYPITLFYQSLRMSWEMTYTVLPQHRIKANRIWKVLADFHFRVKFQWVKSDCFVMRPWQLGLPLQQWPRGSCCRHSKYVFWPGWAKVQNKVLFSWYFGQILRKISVYVPRCLGT